MTEEEFNSLKLQLKGKSREEAYSLIPEIAVQYMLTEGQIEELFDSIGKYIPDPDMEYTSLEEEFYGEVVSDVNGRFDKEEIEIYYPIYEKNGDIDKSESEDEVEDGYYYFLRPFPVEGVYVLEIYRRNDVYADLESTLETSEETLKDPDIINYKDKRAEIFSEKDKKGRSFNDYVEEYDNIKNDWYNRIINAEEESDLMKSLKFVEYGEYVIVREDKDKEHTEEEKEEAKQKYYNAVREFKDSIIDLKLDIVGDYNTYYNVLLTDVENLIPNTNEEEVEAAKVEYEKCYDKFSEDVLKFVGYMGNLGGESRTKLTLDSLAFKVPLRQVKRLDEKFRKSKITYDEVQEEYNKAKEKIKKYGASAKDKKFLAYKLLNRNKDNPDKYGLYREVEDLGKGRFKISIKYIVGYNMGDIEIFSYEVDNKVMYKGWETPDRYFISYEKLESGAPVFHVSCCKSGFFSDTEDILKYYYKGNNSSPIIDGDFNSYDTDGCLSLKRYKTNFSFLIESKAYKTITTNSRGKGIDAVRYGLFDAKKPYPIQIDDTVKQITRGDYNKLTKKEQVEYHKIGDPTIDVDIQQVMSVVNQVTPMLSALGPVAQVMGALEPVMSVLENVKKSTETVQQLLDETKGQIDKIASMPIVDVVAKPLKSILDLITKIAGIIVQFYTENYALIKKIRDTREKFKKENIKKKLKEAGETIEAHYDQFKEKANQLSKSISRKDLEDNDKKKMDVVSPTNEKTKPDGGASYGEEMDLKALIPEVPKEVLEKIETIKGTVKSFQELVDTIDELSKMGEEIDEAMIKISELKAIITSGPAMSAIVESTLASSEKACKPYNDKIVAFERKQEDLEKELRKKKESSLTHEKGVRTIVNLPLEEVIDESTIKERSKPKVEG